MKATEIRQMPTPELLERLTQEEENLARMRFQVSTSQLTNTAQIRILRRDIARMQTVLSERKSSGEEK
ncbi:MAG: 50S ribosomal protein L29 [Ignavibacteriae bacterium]|nr:50S ribosomal protein L29 [Ignavibacteriota bacterium]